MNKLKEIRIKEKEMSQWRLAQESKVHQSRISLLENDLIEATGEERTKLAKALGVSVAEIFGDGEAPVISKSNGEGSRTVSERK